MAKAKERKNAKTRKWFSSFAFVASSSFFFFSKEIHEKSLRIDFQSWDAVRLQDKQTPNTKTLIEKCSIDPTTSRGRMKNGKIAFGCWKKIPKWKWTEHMYEHKNKKSDLKANDVIEILYVFFLAFVPFYILFIVYTLNWLHFWHWKGSKKRNEIPKREPTRHTGDRAAKHYCLHLFYSGKSDAHFGHEVLERLKLNW